MRLFKKACLISFMMFNLNLIAIESNQNFKEISPDLVVLKEGVLFIQEEWGALFSYPEVRFTHQGVFLLARPREKNVIYICANANCGRSYQNWKPDRCGGCGGKEFLVRYQ